MGMREIQRLGGKGNWHRAAALQMQTCVLAPFPDTLLRPQAASAVTMKQQSSVPLMVAPGWSHWVHRAGFHQKTLFLEWEDGTTKMLLAFECWPFRSCARHFSELLAAESLGSSRAEAGVCSAEQQIQPNTCAELLSTSGTPVPWAGGEGGWWLCRPWQRLTDRVRNARKWGGLEMQARYLIMPSEYIALETVPLSPKCKRMIMSYSSSHSSVRPGVAVCRHTGLSRPCASPLSSSLRAKQAVRSRQSARFSFIWHFNVKKNKMKHDAVGRALCAGLPETICIELKSRWLVVQGEKEEEKKKKSRLVFLQELRAESCWEACGNFT